MRRLISLVLLLPVILVAYAQATVTEVIPLGYRSLHEILPVVQPMVGPGGSVGGLRDQLVVTTTPARMAEIKKVLGQLDASPERLVISVRRASSASKNRRSASIHAQTDNVSIGGGGVRVGTGSAEQDTENRVAVSAADRSIDADQDIMQRVQVLEGREAYIATGQDLPVRNRGIGYDTMGYYPAHTGFYVVPRLNGDEVFLELSAGSRQAPVVRRSGYRQPDVNVSNVTTTVAGRLGEWIAIGGTTGSDTSSARGIGYTGRETREAEEGIEVRVEKLQEYR